MSKVVVGIHAEAKALASFPGTVEGYEQAVELIGYLIDHEDGRYYLDASESLAIKAHKERTTNGDKN